MLRFAVLFGGCLFAFDWVNKKHGILWDRTDLSSPLHVAANHSGNYLLECLLAALCAAAVCATWRKLQRID